MSKIVECKAECDQKVSESEGKNLELLQKIAELEQENVELEQKNAEIEKKDAELEKKDAELESENFILKTRAASQGSTYKAVVKKLMQTVDFGYWCVQLTEGAEMWGKNLVLKQLMDADPRLLLKKKSLGWDPYCEQRVNILQQKAQGEMPTFTLLEELEKVGKAWSAEEVAQLNVDYDVDHDEVYEEVPEEWPYEHDGKPFIAEADQSESMVE